MKKLTLLFTTVLSVCVYTICPSCADPQTGAKPSPPSEQDPQEKVKSDVVTFHVIGMKKTASGAT
jgi:hypothetical protein